MEDFRVKNGIERGKRFEIEVDGEKFDAYEGETVGAVLFAIGKAITNYTTKMRQPRGFCCGIGLCYGCAMVIDGVPNTRACQTLAEPGMRVETQDGLMKWEVDH
jgi:sarcosine oxidase subunit alpha